MFCGKFSSSISNSSNRQKSPTHQLGAATVTLDVYDLQMV